MPFEHSLSAFQLLQQLKRMPTLKNKIVQRVFNSGLAAALMATK
jgi:hypothetical protein